MKRMWSVCFGIMLIGSTAVLPAQGQAPAAPVGLAAGLQRSWDRVNGFLTQALEVMPEENFTFQTTPANKTFGAQFGHVANFRYQVCSASLGVANPNQGKNLEQVATKAEMVKALADSAAFCKDAFGKLTDQNALETITQGRNQIARGAALSNLIAHDNEEYGVLTQYLRMKGVVPPSTAAAQRARGN